MTGDKLFTDLVFIWCVTFCVSAVVTAAAKALFL